MSNKRNYGLDIYRILCCIGALTYHVMDDVLGKMGGVVALYTLQSPFVYRGFFFSLDIY